MDELCHGTHEVGPDHVPVCTGPSTSDELYAVAGYDGLRVACLLAGPPGSAHTYALQAFAAVTFALHGPDRLWCAVTAALADRSVVVDEADSTSTRPSRRAPHNAAHTTRGGAARNSPCGTPGFIGAMVATWTGCRVRARSTLHRAAEIAARCGRTDVSTLLSLAAEVTRRTQHCKT